MKFRLLIVLVFASLIFSVSPQPIKAQVEPTPTRTLKPSKTPTATRTLTPTSTETNTPADTPTESLTPTITLTPTETLTPTITPTPTETLTPTVTPDYIAPYPLAPLCPDSGENHDHNLFHTLWDGSRGCHYDHEHGYTPFTQAVENAFPDFDLYALLGNVGIGHTNPSSPMENHHKHGGFKWQADSNAPQGCLVGFDGATIAVDAYAIQYHSFGKQSVEFETRNHSAAGLLRQCKPDNPSDKGYIYTVQLQEYGQRVIPYQGAVLAYPDNFQPQYGSPFAPYFTSDCIGTGLTGCRTSIVFILSRNISTLSIWTSKSKSSVAGEPRPQVPQLLRLLFRIRDTYQVLDSEDLVHPFTWRFVCGDAVYIPVNCRYNNSTTTLHEVEGVIPAGWDGLEGFDTDPRVGRVSGEGYTTRFGTLNLSCVEVGEDCYPIKLVSAFVGKYGSELTAIKVQLPNPSDTPERDVYFCGQSVCSETAVGAVPSGWIGEDN